MIFATSALLLHRLSVTFSGSFRRSRHCSFTIRSVIIVPLCGIGHRHTRFSFSRSRFSPVSALSSSPLMDMVMIGSLCRFSSPSAQACRPAFVVMLWSVSTLSTRPYGFSFRLRYPASIRRLFFPIG